MNSPQTDTASVIFYFPGMSSFTDNGTLVMRATGYENDCHWTGERRFATDDEDYEMWCSFRESFIANSQKTALVSGKQLPEIRALYQKEKMNIQSERAGAANPHAFGTFGISAAEQPRMPKASGDT